MNVWVQAGDDLLLSVRLTPGASGDQVGGVWTDERGARWLSARVRAVPEKGRANDAIIALLGKWLGWPKGAILLESGGTNRLKRLQIMGECTALARTIETFARRQ